MFLGRPHPKASAPASSASAKTPVGRSDAAAATRAEGAAGAPTGVDDDAAGATAKQPLSGAQGPGAGQKGVGPGAGQEGVGVGQGAGPHDGEAAAAAAAARTTQLAKSKEDAKMQWSAFWQSREGGGGACGISVLASGCGG
jgi:hypothetical protein